MTSGVRGRQRNQSSHYHGESVIYTAVRGACRTTGVASDSDQNSERTAQQRKKWPRDGEAAHPLSRSVVAAGLCKMRDQDLESGRSDPQFQTIGTKQGYPLRKCGAYSFGSDASELEVAHRWFWRRRQWIIKWSRHDATTGGREKGCVCVLRVCEIRLMDVQQNQTLIELNEW